VKTTYYRDADGDGYGNVNTTTTACSVPAGYATNSTDCNDASASVHPGAAETCNGVDDNCNGSIDEGLLVTYYRDSDGDGYGNAAQTTTACTAPVGYVALSTDCNDASASVHPGAAEACNGIDDNCNGTVDEGCVGSGTGTVRNVNGTTSAITYAQCGNGTNTNCTQAVAWSSCTSIGKKLVSHASNGGTNVVSLGATSSCYWSISYYTNASPGVAGQCLIGVSNSNWSGCCGTSSWHGNIVQIPATLNQQFGYDSSNDTGYTSGLSNVSGTTWGCIANTAAPPASGSCSRYYVACE